MNAVPLRSDTSARACCLRHTRRLDFVHPCLDGCCVRCPEAPTLEQPRTQPAFPSRRHPEPSMHPRALAAASPRPDPSNPPSKNDTAPAASHVRWPRRLPPLNSTTPWTLQFILSSAPGICKPRP
ncbi:hypothetical protein PsYK624_102240 [Phanerochaete sordida]|uniref:Uncharacterized protein n=1 Tax=Phanerochaete sordida TaxID=48140 RepID=A0A9P3GFN0_9APHY|nr:hypothetical protein PsYK624_102240 [Phanerochaete sordida]